MWTVFRNAMLLRNTVFIISVCNNQLLDWPIENELIWLLSQVPGFAAVLPNIVAKLNAMRDKYLAAPAPTPAHIKVKKWDFSFASIWNAVVWTMLLNFFIQIVNATSRRYLKKQQEKELAKLIGKSPAPAHSS
ncbi:hypothetical protein QQ045_015404 [Rhodiola kirilowii]